VKRETENRGVVGLGLDGLSCSGELGVGIEECSGHSWLWVENLRICGFEVWFVMGRRCLDCRFVVFVLVRCLGLVDYLMR